MANYFWSPVLPAQPVDADAANALGAAVTAHDVSITSLSAAVNVAEGGINNALAAGTTTSGTYVDMPAGSSFSFTKQQAATGLKLQMHVTAQSTLANTTLRFGIQINGVDYDVCQLTFNPANTHLQLSGVNPRVAAGLAAGPYTVKGRMRVVAGGGTLTIATDDWLSILVSEVK